MALILVGETLGRDSSLHSHTLSLSLSFLGTDSTSPSAALPAAPFNITVTKLSSSNVSVAWVPGSDGRALIQSCTVQVG